MDISQLSVVSTELSYVVKANWITELHCSLWLEISSVQLLSHLWLFVNPWTAVHQASLSITNSWNLLKLMFIKSVMPSNYLILCPSLLLLPSLFHSIRVFPNESVLRIKWPKYWSFSFSISPSNEYSGQISFRIDFRYTWDKGNSAFQKINIEKEKNYKTIIIPLNSG